jgi:hypothetical protein
MTRLAKLIATEEGFFTSGSLPQRNRNPGDLRHSPHPQHPGDANAIGVIDSDATAGLISNANSGSTQPAA